MTSTRRRHRVLVTGASRGIGAALVDRMCARGDEIVGVYRRNDDGAHARLERAAESSGRLEMVRADLGHEEGVEAVVRAAGDHLTHLDAVVFNAGVAVRSIFADERIDGLDPIVDQIRIDLQAPLLLLRSLLRADLLARPASVVFVSSNLARHGLSGKVAYGAAKAGIEGAVRGLARELGPSGVRVNAVAPGLLRTDMTADVGDEGFAAYATEVPVGRVGEAEDVAPVIEFLLGSDAAYVSGQVLDVDGGWGC